LRRHGVRTGTGRIQSFIHRRSNESLVNAEARRQHQKTRKRIDVAAKQAKRLAKEALAGPVVKKEKVKKVKPTKEELGMQDAKKRSAGAGKKETS